VNVTLSPVEDTIEIGMSLYEVVPFEPVSRGMHLSVGDELGTMVGVALGGLLSLGEELGTSLGADSPSVGVELGCTLGVELGVVLGVLLGS
jgi:hypothetical protein